MRILQLPLHAPGLVPPPRELNPPRVGPIQSVFTDEARKIVADRQREGGYERALVAIAEADPQLAVQ